MKKQTQTQTDDIAFYSPSKEDVRKQIICMDLGYSIYPVIRDSYKSNRFPNVRIAYTFKNQAEIISKKSEFNQKFLGYRIHQLYNIIYNKLFNINKK